MSHYVLWLDILTDAVRVWVGAFVKNCGGIVIWSHKLRLLIRELRFLHYGFLRVARVGTKCHRIDNVMTFKVGLLILSDALWSKMINMRSFGYELAFDISSSSESTVFHPLLAISFLFSVPSFLVLCQSYPLTSCCHYNVIRQANGDRFTFRGYQSMTWSIFRLPIWRRAPPISSYLIPHIIITRALWSV